MDPIVRRAIARWPNVPAVYGWLKLDRRGRWSVRTAGGVVQTCCLKTHRYGGHFTLSLKNSVGLAAKTVPGNGHDFMRELHTSPHQRRMIAEINAGYRPDLVVLDGVEAFVTGGPDSLLVVSSSFAGLTSGRAATVGSRGKGGRIPIYADFGHAPPVRRIRHYPRKRIIPYSPNAVNSTQTSSNTGCSAFAKHDDVV